MEQTPQKQKRIDPKLPGGFRDYGPAEAIAKQRMLDIIRGTFESFGFDPLQTSSVQRTEVLTGGDEDSGKIIFNVQGSREKKSDMSLRFDLTVPLARFLAANPNIPKPFKRYQIGSVWRGESPQAGRYREFIQADVDIVGASSIDADTEIVLVLYTVFKNLDIEEFEIAYNDRKILNALPEFAGFPPERLWEVLRIIDKVEKLGKDTVLEEIKEKFGLQTREKINKFLDLGSGASHEFELKDENIKGFFAVKDALDNMGIDTGKYFMPKSSLVRGLSYYTGMVVEVTLPDAPEIGSVGGGGRYDDLVAQFTGQHIPAVGVSIGVDRLFAAMEKLGTLKKNQTTTQVLIMQLSSDFSLEYLKIAQELRNNNINTAIYLGKERGIKPQLGYAAKKGIPFVLIYGPDDAAKGVVQIKNLQTREQKEVPKEKIMSFFQNMPPLGIEPRSAP